MTRLSPRRAWAKAKNTLPHCAGSAVYPVCPAAGSTGIYSAYLAAHAASAAAPLIARHDTESLQLVLKLADEENRRQIALACSQSGWSEGAALTLGGQRPAGRKPMILTTFDVP